MKCRPRISLLIAIIPNASPVTAAEPGEARSVIIRDVPHVEQKPDFCGEACVAMALQKLGKPADQDFVFDQSGLSPVCLLTRDNEFLVSGRSWCLARHRNDDEPDCDVLTF